MLQVAALTECQLCVGIEKANIPAGRPRHLQAVLGIRNILVRIRIQLRIRLLPFKDGKKIVIFFLIVCPQAHHLQSKKVIFLLKLLCSIVILHFSPLDTFMRKGKVQDPYL